jgi:hypothetical protein
VTALQQGQRFLAGEPAGVLQFDPVDLQRAAPRRGKAADHQRGGKRPGLGGEIAHFAAVDAGFASALMEEAEPTHLEQAWGMAIRRPWTPESSFRADRRMTLGTSLPLLSAVF